MLRSANDPIDDVGLLNALATVLYPNTNFAAQGGTIYINSWDAIEQGKATYPAIVLDAGDQVTRKAGWRVWQDTLTVKMCYVDMWVATTQTLSQIRAKIKADLQLMKSNLQDNPNLVVTGTGHTVNYRKMTISGYGTRNEKNTPIPTISCYVSIEFHMPLYVSAR